MSKRKQKLRKTIKKFKKTLEILNKMIYNTNIKKKLRKTITRFYNAKSSNMLT